MTKTLTLVAHETTDNNKLSNALGELIAIADIIERDNQVFDIRCPPDTTLTPNLREALYCLHCNFALQNTVSPEKKLFISDMDATMVVGETIDEMAVSLGIGEKISDITARAMRGEMGFKEALSERLSLMKGINKTAIIEMAQSVTTSPGADILLSQINQRTMDSCLISGGFTEFTEHVSKKLGFKHNKANQLGYDEHQKLNGTWVGELVNADVKVAILEQLAEVNNITLEQTIAIGDGANDSLMIAAAGLGIAYYGKPVLLHVANAEIHCGTMADVIHFL